MDVVNSLEHMEMEMEMKKEKGGNEERQQQQQQQQQHFHVLAVDDSLIDRKLLEKLLTVSSYHVTSVESGDKALEYLGLLHGPGNIDTTAISSSPSSSSSFSFSSPSSSSSSLANSSQQEMQMQGLKVNLIMTDYCMPGMSGYDLLKRVKGSSWKDVPVVVMSSENVPSRINMCLEGGAEDFLLKPVQLSDLKKLQPHLLKSSKTYQCPCENMSSSSTTTNYEDDENINKNNSSSKSNMNGVCKRKALVSADALEIRRSKLKD